MAGRNGSVLHPSSTGVLLARNHAAPLPCGWLLVIAAYATVLASVFFPALVLFRAGRPIAVSLMIVFHCGIALLMNLTSFALVMIALDLIFDEARAERIVLSASSSLRTAKRLVCREGGPGRVPSPEL